MDVLLGTPNDIGQWMRLVNEVRGIFPGLESESAIEEHKRAVLEFITENGTLCAKDGAEIVGVLLFSKTHNMLCCLAVSPTHRRKGIAAALVSSALEMLDRKRDITVATFRADDPRGAAPRALYKKFGFAEDELVIEFGCPSQKFVLRGNSEGA